MRPITGHDKREMNQLLSDTKAAAEAAGMSVRDFLKSPEGAANLQALKDQWQKLEPGDKAQILASHPHPVLNYLRNAGSSEVGTTA